MKVQKTTLVMAGTREAHGLVTALLARGRYVVASLPEPERMFGPLPVQTRVGSFKDAADFEAWVHAQHVGTVIDASHSFDDDVSKNVGLVCQRLDLRYLRVLRAPWSVTPLDRWQDVASVRDAAKAIPEGARAFTNTGWASLPDYVDFKGAALFMRQTHPSQVRPPLDFVTFVEGAPPFSQFQEQTLFEDLRITHLICRNVGGAASMSKLLAARSMQMPVMMIARPPTPADYQVVETVAEAMAWEANP
ncbi:MAG: precorrin-6A/cobalt-precorrin-6A reductase [Roseobacter sp.]